jgi:hypothetical protein
MYEGDLARGNSPTLKLFECGQCAPCEPGWVPGGISFGGAFFRDMFGPNRSRQHFDKAGLECGFLGTYSPHDCRGAIEGICFLDVIQYLGPVGRAISRVAQGVGGAAKAGIDGGITIHVCRSATGGLTIPNADVCLGGFIEIGWVSGGHGSTPPAGGTPSTPGPGPGPGHPAAPAPGPAPGGPPLVS